MIFVIQFWFGIGIGIETVKRRNLDKDYYLVLPFIRIRFMHCKCNFDRNPFWIYLCLTWKF